MCSKNVFGDVFGQTSNEHVSGVFWRVGLAASTCPVLWFDSITNTSVLDMFVNAVHNCVLERVFRGVVFRVILTHWKTRITY